MSRILKYLTVGLIILIFGIWIYLNRERGNPVENFNYFHNTFNEKYALFELKSIDWDSIYNYYSEKINEKTTDDELFSILQEILSKLDDRHCYIYRFNQIYFSGFGLQDLNYLNLLSFDFRFKTEDFSLKLIETKYLKKSFDKSLKVYSTLPPIGIRNIFTTGWLNDSIAYLHMTEMSNRANDVHNTIVEFHDKYKDAKGFVVDIRDNIGGYSLPVKELAEIFVEKESIYAISRLRNSDSTNAFKEPEYWKIKPNTERRISKKPIALLINKNTQSAAELFTLMMKNVPNVKLIGSRTSGIFGDTQIGKLPNGWEYRLSVRKTNDAKDIPLEGIGINPDKFIDNRKFIEINEDRVLESAINYILTFNETTEKNNYVP